MSPRRTERGVAGQHTPVSPAPQASQHGALLSLPALAEYLGWSYDQVRRMRMAGEGPPAVYIRGKRPYFRRTSVERWLDNLESAAQSARLRAMK